MGASGSGALTVVKEDAIVTPAASNPTAVKVNSPRGTAGPINLCAAINEANDESLGDISLAAPVTFTLTPFTGSAAPITQTATITGGGVGGTLNACVMFNNVSVNVYNVAISVGGSHYAGAGATAFSVFDPTLGAFKGAGTINHNGRPGIFFFNVRYGRNGAPQGSLLYAERQPGGLVTLKSASIQSMSIVGNTGIIVGTASLNGAGNRAFRAIVVDNGRPTRSDRFGLQVFAPGGAIVPEMTFDPAPLTGGSVKK